MEKKRRRYDTESWNKFSEKVNAEIPKAIRNHSAKTPPIRDIGSRNFRELDHILPDVFHLRGSAKVFPLEERFSISRAIDLSMQHQPLTPRFRVCARETDRGRGNNNELHEILQNIATRVAGRPAAVHLHRKCARWERSNAGRMRNRPLIQASVIGHWRVSRGLTRASI